MKPVFCFPLKTDETIIFPIENWWNQDFSPWKLMKPLFFPIENWWTSFKTDETLVFAIENSGVQRKSSLRLIFGIWSSPVIMN